MNASEDQHDSPHGDAADSSAETEDGHLIELDELSAQFTARIEGLRELLDVIAPHVAALDQPSGLETAIQQSELSERGKDVFRSLFLSEKDPDAADDSPVIEIQHGPPPESQPVPHDELPPRIKAFSDVAQEEPRGVIRMMQRMSHGQLAPRAALLHGSLLTVAVASFEFFLAGLFSLHLIAFPNQLKDDEQEFSLADLVELGSIDEARRLLIERRIDGFMRRGLNDWSRWSERVLGSPFSDLALDFHHLNEIFQRRHIVVHSGGAVSRLYLERVRHSDKPPALGEELPVSADYMRSALAELEVLGHGLVAVARYKWESGNTDRAADSLNIAVYELLRAERWAEAKKLANIGRPIAHSDSSKWMLTVNGWLAMRGLDELTDDREEIRQWDVSALAPQFRLARACLLDEADEALQQLELTLKESPGHLRPIWEWPLLNGLRDDPRIVEIFCRFGYAPERDKRVDTSVDKQPPSDPDTNGER
jgi:hypothetical protein